MTIETIEHGSPDYEKMIALRMDILRRPLGLTYSAEQLASEKGLILIVAKAKEEVVGCCILLAEDEQKMRLKQMAVAENQQGKGLGRKIIAFAESVATQAGSRILCMHARLNALPFYQKMGYKKVGEVFLEIGLPHYFMEKSLE